MVIFQEGILSNILSIVFIILIFSGWFDWYFVKKENLYLKNTFLAVGVLAFFFTFVTIPIPNLNWKLSIGGFVFPMVFYFWIWLKISSEEKLQLFASTILLSAIYFLIKELIRLDPILLFWEQNLEIAFILSIVIVTVSLQLTHRLILVFGSHVFGEFIFHFHHRHFNYPLILGDGGFRDLLWLSVIDIMVLHLVLQWVVQKIKLKKPIKIWKTRGKEH